MTYHAEITISFDIRTAYEVKLFFPSIFRLFNMRAIIAILFSVLSVVVAVPAQVDSLILQQINIAFNPAAFENSTIDEFL